MNDNKKPKHFIVCKVFGILFLIVGIAGFVLSFTNFGNFDNNFFMIGGTLGSFGIFLGVALTFVGFSPEIRKMNIKSEKYIQKENEEDLSDLAEMSADISSKAITKTVKSVEKGLKDTKFCKYCGAEIDADSKFCSHCGKEQ